MQVHRIPLITSQTTDDIVKQIKALVEEMRDKKAEEEIQRIYASDEVIQKMYSGKR